MKIQKAKLIKGQFLDVSFSDGNADVNKSFPSTEAPPKLIKAFQALNHHLADLCEQYDHTGQPDYDNIVVRSYSMKGDDEKEGIILTGLRTLKTGKVIVLNSPFMTLDVTESNYSNCKSLIDCLENCRSVITTYLNNNKSNEEAQLKIFGASPNNVVLKSDKGDVVKEPETAIDIIFKQERDAIKQNQEEFDKHHKEQEDMDVEMPLTIDQLKVASKKRQLTPDEQGLLQRLNADAKKQRKK